jgi:membrane protein DedA with SNARE-associated domain
MELLSSFIQDHAQYAHWAIFFFLMLAGLNFPISEDLLIISAGVLASTLVPENTFKLFMGAFLGAYLSDWVVYWLGRKWGTWLWRIKWFAKIFHPKKLQQIEQYYKNYGILTLIIGRFIPFGIRNCLFVTAGMGKMPFWKFLIADGIACLASNAALFTLANFCGKNSAYLVKYVNIVIFSLFFIALIAFIWYKRIKRVSTNS